MAGREGVLASELACELGISVSELLMRADAAIGRAVDTGGLEAARELSTLVEQRESYAVVRITPALTQRLRDERQP